MTVAYRHARPCLFRHKGNRILMYHAIGTKIESDRRRIYTISPARFGSHMRILAAEQSHSLKALNLGALRDDNPGIMLTFDDGYQDNLTQASPVLTRLGIPFTVFVTTGPVLAREPGFLSPEELRLLDRQHGVTIGAHGATHVPLAECGDRQLKEELAGSKAYLEDLLGHSVDTFSYPHGSVNRRVRDAAERAGFQIGATSRFDLNRFERDPLLVCRTDIWAADSDAVFSRKLAGDWDWMRWRHRDPSQNVSSIRKSGTGNPSR